MQEIIFNMINFKDKKTGKYLSFPTVKGDKGDTGKSAYEIAVDLGYTGTQADWIESLKYVSSPEYDTLMESLTSKESSAVAAASAAASSAQAAKDYADSMAGLKGFEVVILEDGEYANGIPTISNPKESTFYFVPSGTDENNKYNEYIYLDSKWELVGAKEVDLSNYVIRSELGDYVLTTTLSDYATKEDLEDYVETTTLSDYATKEDLNSYTTTSDLSSNYALKSELVTAEEKAAWNAKYDFPETGITEDDLSTEVKTKLNSFFEADPVDRDLLENYLLKTEAGDTYATKASLNDYAKSTDLEDYVQSTTLDDYAKIEDLNDYVETATLDNYALKSELVSEENKIAWSAKYDKPETGIPLTDLSQDVQDVINDPKVEIDATLSNEGQAADAKATGDAIGDLDDKKLDAIEAVQFIRWENAVDGTTVSTTNNMVVLTEKEYKNLTVKLPNTFYFIYDEMEETAAYDI